MQLTTITSPFGARFSVAQAYSNPFLGLITDLEKAGYRIKGDQSGGYNPRNIAGTNKPSHHAFGRAIDINWTDNPRGGMGAIPAELARSLAAKHGLTWGGDWKNPDPMHFEIAGNVPQPNPMTLAQRGPQQMMPQLPQPQQPQEQDGFSGYLQRLTANPLFLMGASVLGGQNIGQGIMGGIQASNAMQRQRQMDQRQAQQDAIQRQLFPLQYQKLQADVQNAGTTELQRNFRAAVEQGYSGNIMDYALMMKRAGKPETSVSVNTGETTEAKMASEFGKEGAKYLLGKPREDAMAAMSTLDNMKTARELLGQGIIAGKGANLISSATGWGKTLGIFNENDDAVKRLARTQAYVANMGREVGNVIRAFGAGTGLSDADREYARQIAGGEIELDPAALARITDIAQRLALAKIKGYNKLVGKVNPNIMPFPLALEEPDMSASAPGSGGWRVIGKE